MVACVTIYSSPSAIEGAAAKDLVDLATDLVVMRETVLAEPPIASSCASTSDSESISSLLSARSAS